MNGRFVFRLLFALVLIGVLVATGVSLYNAGVAQGLAAAPLAQGESQAPLPFPYYGYGPLIRPWGWGLGCLIPLVGFLLVLTLFRFVFLPGMAMRHFRHWGGPHNVPPPFAEWHRRAHETGDASPPAGGPESQPNP